MALGIGMITNSGARYFGSHCLGSSIARERLAKRWRNIGPDRVVQGAEEIGAAPLQGVTRKPHRDDIVVQS
jgi:hypothetical protein